MFLAVTRAEPLRPGARVNIYEGKERGHMTIMPCCAAITQLLIQHNQGVCMGDILAKVAKLMGRDPDITVPVIMSEAMQTLNNAKNLDTFAH